MKILIDHTTHHINFLLHTMWNFSWFMMTLQNKSSFDEADLPEFYIYNGTTDTNLFDTVNKILPHTPFTLLNKSQRPPFFKDIEGPVIHLESSMLLPRSIYYTNFTLPENIKHKNICFPLVTYKYNYKTVTFQGKDCRVKNFVQSRGSFFENDFIADWDERFYMTHALLAKLGDDPPLMSPSPLLHDWGNKIRLIRNNAHEEGFDDEKDFIIGKMSHAVHKFERVSDDRV